MNEMAAFLQLCFERDLARYPAAGSRAAADPAPPASPASPSAASANPGSASPVSANPGSANLSPRRASRASRNGSGPSAVFTVRIAREDFALLEQRAAAACTSPSALARNLIRNGLHAARRTDDLSAAVARVESATAELRAALP